MSPISILENTRNPKDAIERLAERTETVQNLGLGWLMRVFGYRLFPPTVPTLCPLLGTSLSACGSSPPVRPPGHSSVTPTMSSPFPSPPTTARSFPDPVTAPSSSGTPWETASTPSPTRATPSGCRACASAPTPRTPSSSPLAGTSLSRYVFEIFLSTQCVQFVQMMFAFFYVFATSEPLWP